jgi:hypothetical protein
VTISPNIPIPSMLRTPIDPAALGRFWSEVQLDRDVAVRWTRDGLDRTTGRRVLEAFDDAEAYRRR